MQSIGAQMSDLAEKLEQYQTAVDDFVARIADDRNVLAVVQIGTLDETTVWRKSGIHLWLIEADGVTRRLKSDGNDERIFRSLVENGVNIHAELIPRSRFKRMIEGSSRTAFRHNFFASRTLVYCDDASIKKWFAQANKVATKDQDKELLVAMTWAIWGHRHASRLLNIKGDNQLCIEQLICVAHSLAAIHIIQQGAIYEHEVIHKAIELNPELFQTVYLDVITKRKSKKLLQAALDAIDGYLEDNAKRFLKPMLAWMKKQKRMIPLSEMSEHFAHTQLFPWHLESACDWLEEKGELEKVSAPFKLTAKSRIELEEPCYLLD